MSTGLRSWQWRSWLAVLLACGAFRCVEPATQVVVTVNADPAVSMPLKQIRAFVYDVAATDESQPQQEVPFSLTIAEPRAGEVRLPFSFGIGKGGASSFKLVIKGYTSTELLAQPVIEQKVIASFHKGKTLSFEVFLAQACLGVSQCSGLLRTCTASPLGAVASGSCGDVSAVTGKEIEKGEEIESWTPMVPAAVASSSADAASPSSADARASGAPSRSEAGVDTAKSDAGAVSPASPSAPGMTTLSGPGAWTVPGLVESEAADVYGPIAARNRAGDVVVAWWQSVANTYLTVRRFVKGAWEETPLRVSGTATGQDRGFIDLSIDRSGTAQLFFNVKLTSYWGRHAGDGRPAFVSTQPTVLGDQTYAIGPMLTSTEEGLSTAFWAGVLDTATNVRPLYLNRLSAIGWGVPELIGTVSGRFWPFDAVSNAVGDFVAAVGTETIASTASGASAIKTLVGKGTSVSSPSPPQMPGRGTIGLQMDAIGNVMGMIGATPMDQSWQVYCTRYDVASGAWEPLTPISMLPVWGADLAALAIGGFQAVWSESIAMGSTSGRIQTSQYVDGQGWSAATPLSDGIDLPEGVGEILVSGNGAGSVMVVWEQGLTLSDGTQGRALGYNRFTKAAGWAKPGIVTTFTGDTSLVVLTLGDDERALVVWSHDETQSGIRSLKWSRFQ